MSSRLRKKAGNRLLTRAAQKGSHVFAGTYRAATVTERGTGGFFPQPASVVRGFLLGLVFIELLAAQGSSPDQAFAHALQLQQSGDLEGSAREYREVLAA